MTDASEPSIDDLFLALARAVDDAHDAMGEEGNAATEEAEEAIEAVMLLADALVARITAMPEAEATRYHPALAQLEPLLESLHASVLETRTSIGKELQEIDKKQRAMATYLKKTARK